MRKKRKNKRKKKKRKEKEKKRKEGHSPVDRSGSFYKFHKP